ncbi:MAG: glycosyltransferase [Elusimicrobiota bacterium]|nr:glycosyltransferase [Endomicrobiia bacterium]MDW8166193.1 glycosyltransferase [Elusimicrobiota bacterium]
MAKKLLFYTSVNTSKVTGANLYVSRIIKKLDENNHFDIDLFALDFAKEEGRIDEFKNFKNVKIRYYKFKPFYIFSYIKIIIDSLRKFRDVEYVAFRTIFFHPLMFLVKIINPKCKIVWFHDGIIEEISFLKNNIFSKIIVFVFSLIEKFFSRYVDYYLPVSHKMKEYSQKKRYTIKNSIVLPCIVDTKLFHRIGIENAGKEIVIGYAGSLTKWQGFENGCKYIKFLERNNFKIFFNVLTFDIRKANEFLDKYSINGSVKLIKNDDVPKEMRKWWFAIIPKVENLITEVASPLKVAEAMAMGIPLIISKNIGDYSEIVNKNRWGIVVDFSNVETWNETLSILEFLLNNYEKISNEIREYAKLNLSLEYLNFVIYNIFK